MSLAAFKDKIIYNNVIWGLSIKGGSLFLTIITLPILLKNLGNEYYGVWVIVSTLQYLIGILDIGMGSNLKNELSKMISVVQKKILISTTYFSLLILTVIFTVLYLIISYCVDLQVFFGIPIKIISEDTFKQILILQFCGFTLQVLLSPILSVLSANNNSGKLGVFNLISNMLLFLVCYYIKVDDPIRGLVLYSLFFAFLPPVITFFGTVYAFKHYFCEIKPEFRYIERDSIFKLMKGSGYFFLLQISALLVYQMTSILISKYGTLSQVSQYNVSYRYFNVIYITFVTLMNPLWPIVSKYFYINDMIRIRRYLNLYIIMFAVTVFIFLGWYFLSKYLISSWLGMTYFISDSIMNYSLIYIIILSWNHLFINIINGTGKIMLEVIISIIVIVCFFPLVLFLGSYFNLGIIGVFIVNIGSLLLYSILMPLQVFYLLNSNAKGIWNSGLKHNFSD